MSGKKLKIPHTFFEFFFCKIWVYTKNDDQVVPFLWYTYIFLQLQLTILFANKKAILLLFQFMTLSIFLTPQSTPFTKNAVSVLGYMKNIWFCFNDTQEKIWFKKRWKNQQNKSIKIVWLSNHSEEHCLIKLISLH